MVSQMRDNFKLAEFHHWLSNSYSPYDLIDIMSEVNKLLLTVDTSLKPSPRNCRMSSAMGFCFDIVIVVG